MKRQVRKLTLARETLRRLEDASLVEAMGAVVAYPTNKNTICFCITDLCITAGYSGCSECNCA